MLSSSEASSNTRMNMKTLIIVISGVAASLIIAGSVGAYFVFGKDSKAAALTSATSGTEQTSLSQATSVTGTNTNVTQPAKRPYTAVPTPSEPFIPKGNGLDYGNKFEELSLDVVDRNKATSVTTAASDTSLPKTTSVAAASSGTSAVTTASESSTTTPEPKYTAVPISKDPFIPRGEELRPFYLQVGKKYFGVPFGIGKLEFEKTFFTLHPNGFAKAFLLYPDPMTMDPHDMTSLGFSYKFDPKAIYSQAVPVPGSSCNEFYIKVTGAGGPQGAKDRYICEKESTSFYQGKDYKLCESIDESCLKFQAFLETSLDQVYIFSVQQKLIKDGVTLKNLHIPGYTDQSKAANEIWFFITETIRPASDPSMALTVDSKKAVSLKPLDRYGNSNAQKFVVNWDNGNVSIKHKFYVGKKCEELYLSIVERQLALVKDKVHFQTAEFQDIPDAILDEANKIRRADIDCLFSPSEDENFSTQRRPYLPKGVRSKIRQLSRSELLRFFHSGEVIHVDMSQDEAKWIERMSSSFRSYQRKPINYILIAKELPGRTACDVEAYLADNHDGRAQILEDRVALIVGKDRLVMRKPVPESVEATNATSSLATKQRRPDYLLSRSVQLASPARKRFQAGGYKPVTSWPGCSGSCIQLATSTSPLSNGTYSCLVGSATETDQSRPQQQPRGTPLPSDPYNRPGELVGVLMDASRLSFRVIDGHKTTATTEDRSPLRSTVSAVVYSETNSAYITGGYDGMVALWSDDRFASLGKFCAPSNQPGTSINSIIADNKSYGLFYGTSTGELFWCADPLSSPNPATGIPKLDLVATQAGHPKTDPFSNAVDVLAMTTKSRHALYSAVGYSTNAKAGIVRVFDMAPLKESNLLRLPENRSLTDVSLHPNESLLAVATGNLLEDSKNINGDGKIRLFDLRSPTDHQPSVIITTVQQDIHRLAFCSEPSGNYIYSNDASTGMMAVHDLRSPVKPLWTHTHSPASASDHFMGFSWMPAGIAGMPSDSGCFWTGGNDAHLRLWDVGRGDPLVESHDMNQPINNVTVSSDGVHVWVGTEFGSISLLSRNKSLADVWSDNMYISFDPTI